MRRTAKYFLVCLVTLFSLTAFSQKDFTALVNPFIGTGGHGHTYPGASMPFGMMQLSPDTRMADWDGSSGYHYSDSVIYGFSHTHLSGTGIPDYCDILLMPFAGNVQWNNSDYRSRFLHKNEKASPGYYEVFLDKHKIQAQLSVSYRSGMHQYTFPSAAVQAGLLIDLRHRDPLLDVFMEVVSDREVRGYRRSKSWAKDQIVYFYLRSEQPFTTEILNDSLNGKPVPIKMALLYAVPSSKKVRFKVGISPVSMDGAKKNLDQEIPHWNFDKLKSEAKLAWNKELGKIEIKGGTPDQQTAFYTALYHCFLAPNIYQDVDGQFRGTDGKIHRAEGFTNYTVFSLWDTYRAYHPLMTILNTARTTDWIKTFLKQYEYGGMLPVWELSANETFCMIGYHAVPVIVDAWQKGIRGFDSKLALKAMRSYAESDRFGLDQYRKQGFITNDHEHESVSKTLEYAYDDWCIAQMAKMTGNQSVYKTYIRRAQYYKNLFDPRTRHMRGKVQAIWHSPFDPAEINNFFTEGNSWHYSFAVPHDVHTMIRLYGGKAQFVSKLQQLFTTSSVTTGREQPDVTGLIGQYAQGNEPSHHMAYLFNYAGQPWKTQELIHRICNEFYLNAPDGLIGNEDCGQMSAWYVFSAMGFYPVCPGNGEYAIGTPLFDEVVLHLENGKDFVIKATRETPEAFYINTTQLNGQSFTHSYLRHKDIENGGRLEFSLSKQYNRNWGTKESDLPHSVIEEELIVPAPYFDAKSNKFRDSMQVVIRSLDTSAKIHYRIVDPKTGKQSASFAYTGPFYIYESNTIRAFYSDEATAVQQYFHKLPTDKTIRVTSQVHPMYTAGGPEALIDGIIGNSNWRAGEWQSYFDQDFEAIIDLQQEKEVRYIGVHVLQEVSPWIIYPKELIWYVSNDGKIFTEAGRVRNNVPVEEKESETQELGREVSLKTRYIMLKAVNGGKLPAWHESAGNGSHLFIDEVIIR